MKNVAIFFVDSAAVILFLFYFSVSCFGIMVFLCYDVHSYYYYSDAYHLGDMHADLLL